MKDSVFPILVVLIVVLEKKESLCDGRVFCSFSGHVVLISYSCVFQQCSSTGDKSLQGENREIVSLLTLRL